MKTALRKCDECRLASDQLLPPASPHASRITHHASRITFHVSRLSPPAPRSPHSRRGIALIIVMISIFVLTILAGGFAVSMKVETRLARNADDQARIEWMGRSSIEYACWVRACSAMTPRPERPGDWSDDAWATGHGMLGPTNQPFAEVVNPLPFRLGVSDYGTANWQITDLESKININTATFETLQQVFIAMNVDAGQLTSLCNSILDWKDNNKDPRIQGAKTEYYQSLNPPYVAKNGPIDDLTELLLVKGVTREMYWGTGAAEVEPGAAQPTPNRFGQLPSYSFGLVDIFTPFGKSLNWHTAQPAVFQAMGLDPIMAQNLVQARSAVGVEGAPGPRSITDALNIAGLNPNSPQTQIIASKFDPQGRSYTFQVTVDAAIGADHRYFTALIGQNGPKDVQILSFYWSEKPPKPANAPGSAADMLSIPAPQPGVY